MIPHGNSKPEAGELDPTKLAKLLEIELMQKRAAWQQAKARRGQLRALSFFFLFMVIFCAIAAFYLFFSPGGATEGGGPSGNITASPTPPPR